MKIPKILGIYLDREAWYSSVYAGHPQKIEINETIWTVSTDETGGSFQLNRPLSSGQLLKLTFVTFDGGIFPNTLKMRLHLDDLWVDSYDDTKKISITGVRTILENELPIVAEQIEKLLNEEGTAFSQAAARKQQAAKDRANEAKRRAEDAK